MELLNQRSKVNEYDCALVCAMAVMGRSAENRGWHSPDSYTPLLSKVIKVARFMVVYKALTLDDDAMALLEARMRPLSQEEEEDDDEGYEEPDRVGGSAMEVDGYIYSGMEDEGYGSDESPLFTSSSPRHRRCIRMIPSPSYRGSVRHPGRWKKAAHARIGCSCSWTHSWCMGRTARCNGCWICACTG